MRTCAHAHAHMLTYSAQLKPRGRRSRRAERGRQGTTHRRVALSQASQLVLQGREHAAAASVLRGAACVVALVPLAAALRRGQLASVLETKLLRGIVVSSARLPQSTRSWRGLPRAHKV